MRALVLLGLALVVACGSDEAAAPARATTTPALAPPAAPTAAPAPPRPISRRPSVSRSRGTPGGARSSPPSTPRARRSTSSRRRACAIRSAPARSCSTAAACASVDPALAVLRVDARDGATLATVANFSIHPTTLGAKNRAFSADVVGGIAKRVEATTGAPLLFAQGAEGDVAPASDGDAAIDALGSTIGDAITKARSTAATKDRLRLAVSNATVDFGKATLELRPDGLSTGAIDLSLLGKLLGGSAGAIDLGPDMVDHAFRFQAIRIDDDVVAAVPGEPIHTLGVRIRDAGTKEGFAHTMVFGLANGHMSYVVDADEHDAGGYEAVATLFGRETGDRLVDAATTRMHELR